MSRGYGAIQRQIQARIDGCRIDWDVLLEEFEPPELAMVLRIVWPLLPDDQRIWAVSTAWTGAAGGELDVIRRPEWLTMFRAVGYIDEDKPGTPTEQITLWRGGVTKTGMSWTADRETATWFQRRHAWSHHPTGLGQAGKLWTVTVGPDRLLAHYHHQHRGEDEYVIDPTGLKVKEVSARRGRIRGAASSRHGAPDRGGTPGGLRPRGPHGPHRAYLLRLVAVDA